MAHSPDREWFWDGGGWIPAWSPDRAWWWDGVRWVPVGRGTVAMLLEPTVWTRRLQLIIAGLTVYGLVVAIFSVPVLMGPVFQQSIDQSTANQPGLTPAEAAQFRQTMGAVFSAILISSGILGLAFYTVVFIGIWKLWRWVFWYFIVIGFLAALAIPQDIVYAFGVGPIHLPSWFLALGVLSALAWLGLAIWMVMLNRRYGNWARQRVPSGAPATDTL
jgi:hypothetical protein